MIDTEVSKRFYQHTVSRDVFSNVKETYKPAPIISVYDSEILVPIDAEYADKVLKEAVFSRDNSKKVIETAEGLSPNKIVITNDWKIKNEIPPSTSHDKK